MARIRSIKPEFHTSEQVMSCSRDARLLFIGMWNFADDLGHIPNSPKTLKAQIFPGDEDMNGETVRRLIDELSSKKLVRLYVIDDKEYLKITGWHHQKIDRPQRPKYPPPPEGSTNDRRTLDVGEEHRPEPIPEGSAEPARRSRRELDELEVSLRSAAKAENSITPGLFDLSSILGLLDAGYSLADDILPVIRAKTASGFKVRGWSYFVEPIREAREKRLGISGKKAPQIVPIDWQKVAQNYKASGTWPKHLGPEPGYSGCKMPAEIIAAHRFKKVGAA